MNVKMRNELSRTERAAFVAACILGGLAWPAAIVAVLNMSVGWQLLLAAGGFGLLALRIILGFLAAVAGLICRR